MKDGSIKPQELANITGDRHVYPGSLFNSALIVLILAPLKRYEFSASKLYPIFFFNLKKSMKIFGKKYFRWKKINFRWFFSIQFSLKIFGKFYFSKNRKYFLFFSSEKNIYFLKLKKKWGTVSMQKNHIFRLVGFLERSEQTQKR